MAELIQYQLTTDANYKPHGCIVAPSKYINQYMLTAGVAKMVIIPTGATIAMFFCTADVFYVAFSGTAVLPVADITNGSAPDNTPTTRNVAGYASFSVICGSDALLTICYYN